MFFIREDAWNKIIYWPCLEVYTEDFLWVSVVIFTAIPSVTTGSSDPCFIQLLYYYKYSNLSSSFLAKNTSSFCTCRTTQTSAGLICKTMRFSSFLLLFRGNCTVPNPCSMPTIRSRGLQVGDRDLTHERTDVYRHTYSQTEEAGKLKEAMVTNHFPCSAITNHSTLCWASLHPGLEWHLETVEGGLFSSALCCCYYCLCWERPISTYSGPPAASHHLHALNKHAVLLLLDVGYNFGLKIWLYLLLCVKLYD